MDSSESRLKLTIVYKLLLSVKFSYNVQNVEYGMSAHAEKNLSLFFYQFYTSLKYVKYLQHREFRLLKC